MLNSRFFRPTFLVLALLLCTGADAVMGRAPAVDSDEAGRELQLGIEKLLEISRPLNELKFRIHGAAERIQGVEFQAFELMARRDQPPLWLIFRTGYLAEGLFPLLREKISGELADVLEYLWSREGRVAAHGLVFVLFLASFFWLRRRSRSGSRWPSPRWPISWAGLDSRNI